MKPIISCLIVLALTGCATYKGAGSQTWYDQRNAELELARKSQKITEAEYQSSKNQIDNIRVNYINRDDYYPHTTLGFGYWY